MNGRMKQAVQFLALVLLNVPGIAFAQNTKDGTAEQQNPHLPGGNVGPTDNTLLDITTLESYNLHLEITKEMLEVLPGENPLTVDFGVAYDELNLIAFVHADHI